jgi:hypothetical protein
MVGCCDKALEVEDLLNQPLHCNDLTSGVSIESNFKILQRDAEREQITRSVLCVELDSYKNTQDNLQ